MNMEFTEALDGGIITYALFTGKDLTVHYDSDRTRRYVTVRMLARRDAW
jgi:hypothetical protein